MDILESDRLIFRDHEIGDLDAYCEMEADPEVRRYVGGAPRPRSDAERRFKAGLKAGGPLTLRAVVLKATGVYIGRSGLYPSTGPEHEARFSVYLATAYWGQGYATEAGLFFLRYGFETLGLSRIETTIRVGHDASKRVLERIGFVSTSIEVGAISFEHFEILNPNPPS